METSQMGIKSTFNQRALCKTAIQKIIGSKNHSLIYTFKLNKKSNSNAKTQAHKYFHEDPTKVLYR